MTAEPKYTNEAQQRICRLILLMGGHEVRGVAPSALAKALGTSASNITRDLRNLQQAGIAETFSSPAGEVWRLAPKLVQIAVAMFTNLERAEAQARETRQRYTLGSNQ